VQYPELVFTGKELDSILKELTDDTTLLVTDPYNYPLVKKYGRTIMVENNFHSVSYDKIKKKDFRQVIGIGGCSALDIGRACAEGLKFTGIPTVLSTSCISVNISILRSKDKTRKIKTVIPDKIIIPLGTLLNSHKKELEKWCASGFGDLFANISAVIDYEYKNKSFSPENIYTGASVALEAMDWVIDSFERYDETALRKLANYLHNSCLEVIEKGHNNLSAGCEHEFYETIIRQEKYSNRIQTHGILVIVGTLFTLEIYEIITGNKIFLSRLKEACRKVGLPVNYKEFELIGVKKEHIMKALKKLKPGSIISDNMEKINLTLSH